MALHIFLWLGHHSLRVGCPPTPTVLAQPLQIKEQLAVGHFFLSQAIIMAFLGTLILQLYGRESTVWNFKNLPKLLQNGYGTTSNPLYLHSAHSSDVGKVSC